MHIFLRQCRGAFPHLDPQTNGTRIQASFGVMVDPYTDLSDNDREIVLDISTAIANGELLHHNRSCPLAARRVLDELRRSGAMSVTPAA